MKDSYVGVDYKLDEDFGDRLTIKTRDRSYQNGLEFAFYITGMNECSVTVRGGWGNGDVIAGSRSLSGFLSADEALLLRDWLDEHLVPSQASFTSSYTKKKNKRAPY